MLGLDIWILWMILAAIFVVAEIFTAGFFIMWFGIGAVGAGILALVGLSAGWQLAGFVCISLFLVLISRRFADKITKEQPPGVGANRFVGKEAIVIEEINNDKGKGLVRMDHEEWRAESADGTVIPVNTHVRTVQIAGTHLIVHSLS
ncbi:NfeD family protein [candidate division KSB1 bacterium]|nr:MAG: NfeD family protein [candidate division KSB1 bacterium]